MLFRSDEEVPKDDKKKKAKKEKNPNLPKRALTPYFFFLADYRAKKKDDGSTNRMTPAQVASEAGTAWKTMDDEEKKRAFVALQMCVDVCVTTVLGRSNTAEQMGEPEEYVEAARHPTRKDERKAEALEADEDNEDGEGDPEPTEQPAPGEGFLQLGDDSGELDRGSHRTIGRVVGQVGLVGVEVRRGRAALRLLPFLGNHSLFLSLLFCRLRALVVGSSWHRHVRRTLRIDFR